MQRYLLKKKGKPTSSFHSKELSPENITAEALLGIGYLKDVEDVEAAFALGEKVAQGKIFDILDNTADDDDDDGVITIKIGDK